MPNILPPFFNNLQPLISLLYIIFSAFLFQSQDPFGGIQVACFYLLFPVGYFPLLFLCCGKIHRFLCQHMIHLCDNDHSDTYLGAMQDRFSAFHEKTHLPKMGQMMLTAGCRSGIAHIIHGNSRNHQSFHQTPNCLRISLFNLCTLFHYRFHRTAHHVHHIIAVVFSIDHLRKFPVQQTGIFSKHIPQSGGDQFHGSLRHNLCVTNDCHRAVGIFGHLYMVKHQSCTHGYKTVHTGGGSYDHIIQFQPKTDIFTHIIDGSRTHRQQDFRLRGTGGQNFS